MRSDAGQEDLIVEAGMAAMDDAGITPEDINASWFGCTSVSANHALLNFSLKLGYTAMTKVQNAGATGADALRGAITAVASGMYDVTLAAGVEKPTDSGFTEFTEGGPVGGSAVGADAVLGEFRTPAFATLYLQRYSAVHDIPARRIRTALTRLTTRSRRAGARNPLAAFRSSVSEDEVEGAPVSSWPLTVLDCCQSLDGAGAAIVCSEAFAKSSGRPYIVLEGIGVASGGLEGRMQQDYDYLGLPEARIAAQRAYRMAGIVRPDEEIDHAQIFDLTTAAELIAYEDLGLAAPGTAVERVLAGDFDLEGRIPTNTDGGLLCNGFQAGASGIRQVYESYLQLTGRAGERQLPNVRRSVVYSAGGAVGSFSAFVQVYGKPT
ncbi:MAG: acetyl-CoA acetyltransferase [Dehalococcoidia bacterium]|nr:acetyl-CoA acetyltransferase [Dehalococcoidia bacterium]